MFPRVCVHDPHPTVSTSPARPCPLSVVSLCFRERSLILESAPQCTTPPYTAHVPVRLFLRNPRAPPSPRRCVPTPASLILVAPYHSPPTPDPPLRPVLVAFLGAGVPVFPSSRQFTRSRILVFASRAAPTTAPASPYLRLARERALTAPPAVGRTCGIHGAPTAAAAVFRVTQEVTQQWAESSDVRRIKEAASAIAGSRKTMRPMEIGAREV
jgi:hypothetical protein